MRKVRFAFTIIELIFVIVIMGILGRFGVEFLTQAYSSFIFSQVNSTLHAQSTVALETIAARLQFRIKDSIIARTAPGAAFQGLAGSNLGVTATVLEWIGSDIDGLRGDVGALYGGIIDIDQSNAGALTSPMTNAVALNALITELSPGPTAIGDSALFFTGSGSNVLTDYGWDGAAIINQGAAMHPVNTALHPTIVNAVNFLPIRGDNSAANNFNGVTVHEYYQFAWTAYAVQLADFEGDGDNDLILWYDYQPWRGETSNINGTPTLLMENVETFRFKADGSVVKLQICVHSDIIDGDRDGGGYAICKEKTIF